MHLDAALYLHVWVRASEYLGPTRGPGSEELQECFCSFCPSPMCESTRLWLRNRDHGLLWAADMVLGVVLGVGDRASHFGSRTPHGWSYM